MAFKQLPTEQESAIVGSILDKNGVPMKEGEIIIGKKYADGNVFGWNPDVSALQNIVDIVTGKKRREFKEFQNEQRRQLDQTTIREEDKVDQMEKKYESFPSAKNERHYEKALKALKDKQNELYGSDDEIPQGITIERRELLLKKPKEQYGVDFIPGEGSILVE